MTFLDFYSHGVSIFQYIDSDKQDILCPMACHSLYLNNLSDLSFFLF